ncbi:MAG: hypothetical protein IJU98_00415 [Synergistaceae bacterium]|nr:hypothetical protein [Synergistaceae bacterium]
MPGKSGKKPLRKRGGLRLIAACGVFLFAFLGLCFLRFHAARLAYHLNSINLIIQQYANEETALRQELSAMISPVRVYTYCRESLNMQKTANAETLPVRSSRSVRVAATEPAPAPKGWTTSLAWLFGE